MAHIDFRVSGPSLFVRLHLTSSGDPFAICSRCGWSKALPDNVPITLAMLTAISHNVEKPCQEDSDAE